MRGRVPGTRGRRGGRGPANEIDEWVIRGAAKGSAPVRAVADIALDAGGFVGAELAGAEQAQVVRAGVQGRGRFHGRSPRGISWSLPCNAEASGFLSQYQAGRLLAQSAEDVRLGDVDGVDRDSHLGRHRLGRAAAQDEQLEGPPGGRFELPLDLLQQRTDDVLVVLAVPL